MHEVYKNGAADKDGRLQPGDRIVSVNGTAFSDLTHEEALRILRSSQDRVSNPPLLGSINHNMSPENEKYLYIVTIESSLGL